MAFKQKSNAFQIFVFAMTSLLLDTVNLKNYQFVFFNFDTIKLHIIEKDKC